jgi:hypothetical protein
LVDERYVRVAVGRDYGDVAPVRGHVLFAALPPAKASLDPPEVEVTIVSVPSRDHPLGFAPDDQPTPAAPEPLGGRPPDVPHLKSR